MENQTWTYEDPFHYTPLDTVYNGRCQLLESDLDMTPGTYVELTALEKDLNGTSLAMFVYNPGTGLELVTFFKLVTQ